MGTTRLFTRGIAALSLVAIVSSCGWAANHSRAANEQSYSEANAGVPPASAAAPSEATLVRASRVMHAKVKSPEGTTLGRVDDLVLTPDLNAISYVAVSSGGILGIGSTLHAVPWSELKESTNHTYVIPVSEQQFQQSPGFSSNSWPSSAETSLSPSGQASTSGQTAAAAESVKDRRFSRIKGSKVKAGPGRSAGDVRDLMIVMDNGRIAYTIVSYGGLLGIGQRYAAAPQGAITLEPGQHVARLEEGNRAALYANSFPPSQWPDLSNVTVARQLDRTFGVQTSETVLGYVPAEGGAVAAAPAPRTPRPGQATRPPTSGTTPAAPSPAAARPMPADLTGTFNPSKITTIDGTVVDQGKFHVTPSGPEMLWMRVRTSSGQMHWVNLGPRSYISAQDFYVVPGDEVHLSGSEVAATAPGRQVFLPTQVTYSNQTLRLRSDNGAPLWEGQGMTPAEQGRQPGATPPSTESQKQSRAGTGATPPLGYTPAQEQGATGAARPGETAGQGPTQFAPSGLIDIGALDLSNLRTIEGTVTEAGKSQTPGGGPEVIWLRVRTTNNQFMNVQVGPRDYVSRQDFFVVSGDRVRMTGWNARIPSMPSAAPVFVAADISQDGHTLQLRNRDGEPVWTTPSGPAGRPQQQPGATEQTPAGRTPEAQTPPTQESPTPSQPTETPGAAGSQRTPSRTAAEPNEPNEP